MPRSNILTVLILLASTGMSHARGPVIVIDPGHGGSNKGAATIHSDYYEKDITLAVSNQFRKHIRSNLPDATIVLTRNRDRYVMLERRVLVANASNADVMISIHANASAKHNRRGFEIYVLNEDVFHQETVRNLRRLPWASYGGSGFVTPSDALIVRYLTQRGVRRQSDQLAWKLSQALAEVRPEVPNRGVRQASFDVLVGVTMPAVLVEVGFADHHIEGAELLKSRSHRQIGAALSRGLRDYLRLVQHEKKHLATVRKQAPSGWKSAKKMIAQSHAERQAK